MNRIALIIDDDPDFRSWVSDILEREGWHVMQADDGDVGLQIVREHHPAVVLCDLLMPRCNGFHVCRALRADVTLRHTRVLVTSGRHFDADRAAAREAGADEYLTKPISASALIAALRPIRLPTEPGGATSEDEVATDDRTWVKFWGVRGSIPTPGAGTVRYGGNTSCLEVRAGGQIIILDGGTGLRGLGRQLLSEFGGKSLQLTLLLSHTHWDHIQGLPFFQPLYSANCELRILGYEGARQSLVNVLSGQMESPYFPVPFTKLPGNIQIEELKEMEFNVGSVRVFARFANHPGICVGYRLFTPQGSLAFFPDNEPRRSRVAPATTEGGSVCGDAEFLRAEEAKFVEFLRGVDVLVLDAQYDCAEYERHIGWGHGCVDDAVHLALECGAKQLYLFHHDPDHDDDKVTHMLAHARDLVHQKGGQLLVEAAREGDKVDLAPKNANSGKRNGGR